MIHKSNRDTPRRILSLTAVRPCESVASSTLLSSLLDLAHSISDSDDDRFFASQKRNARESIRIVTLVRFFLVEVSRDVNRVSQAGLLSFSELHFAFQKMNLLLNDCSKRGARIWILMNSEIIAGEFRSLVRLVATALDVFPLESIGEEDASEVFELVAKQARKARFEVDAKDERAVEEVRMILNQFERKLEPEKGLIKRVLEYLEIRSWEDCNNEVTFLEEEIRDCVKERESPLLNSLIALMCYSRAVIFNGGEMAEISEVRLSVLLHTMSCLNPEDFRCPISLELMTDPVTISTGQTYDRASIQKWLNSGNQTCPKTGEKLKTSQLVSNLALKKLIQQFCVENGVSLTKSCKEVSKTESPGSLAAGEIVRFIAEFLAGRLTYGTDHQKTKAAFEVRVLAKTNIYNRIVLIDLEVIPPLLDLLTSMDPTTQENSISALLKLSKCSSGQKSIIDSGGLGLIITTMKTGLKTECKSTAAAIVFYLTSSEKHRRFLGRSRTAIPTLVDLIKDGSISTKRNAMAALFGIIQTRTNRDKLLSSTVLPILLNLVNSLELVTDALSILSVLSEDHEGARAIILHEGVKAVMGLMVRKCKVPKTAREYCVSILMDVCNNGGREVVAVLAKESSLMPQLYSVAVDGSSSTSRKARSIINLLQRFKETSYSRLAMADRGVEKGEGVE